MNRRFASLCAALLAAAFVQPSLGAEFRPAKPECVAGAKPGGGFDLTCRLAAQALHEFKLIAEPMRVTYLPGGIGAVAYNTMITQRADDANAIVAFSAGSSLNIAQGKFGKYDENAVRWLAVIGTDFGAIMVRKDSPYKSLKELMAALKADPSKVVFGAGGTIGSQDWMKAAMIAKQAGVDPRSMRYVAFEGGGAAITALLGGHVQAVSGDASESIGQMEGGAIRVLAVLSERRLPGKLAAVPTAREQGYDVVWPTYRGFYLAPKVTDEQYNAWVGLFDRILANPGYAKLRDQRGLFEFAKTGKDAEAFVKKSVAGYRDLAREAGLLK
ncbi:MAG: tripartite tricarboxylate transporter substrate binding protein [Rhodocyclaceae bacterium]